MLTLAKKENQSNSHGFQLVHLSQTFPEVAQRYTEICGFFNRTENSEKSSKAADVLKQLKTTKVSGIIFHCTTAKLDPFQARKVCQTAVKQTLSEKLSVLPQLLEKANKAIRMEG
eukprot:6489420-Amphidinium_carterae.1